MRRLAVLVVVLLVLVALLLLPAVAQAEPPSNVGLAQRVASLEQQVETLQTQIASLQDTLSQIASNPVLELGTYVSVDLGSINDLPGPNILITGANLHIRNGDAQSATNGLGNLVIGYNLAPVLGGDPEVTPPFDLTTYRTGSHNLVLGSFNRYGSYGSIVAGSQNTVGSNSAVLSGDKNSATYGSAILSGHNNQVNAWSGAIVGGQGNALLSAIPGGFGQFAAILGGMGNQATGSTSTVSGGQANTASGGSSSVSGGRYNTASGRYASVSGGQHNEASADYSSIGGGVWLSVVVENGWAAGQPLVPA